MLIYSNNCAIIFVSGKNYVNGNFRLLAGLTPEAKQKAAIKVAAFSRLAGSDILMEYPVRRY